jgi:transcriptional regulator with XRE-family HTH domain
METTTVGFHCQEKNTTVKEGMTKMKEYLRTELKTGITQVALAKKLGVSAATIYKWLNTDAVPDTATLKKVQDKTGIPVSFFLEKDSGTIPSTSASSPPLPEDETRILELYRRLKVLKGPRARAFAEELLDLSLIKAEREQETLETQEEDAKRRKEET